MEQTDYPFREKIRFTINTNKSVKFPFHLRIPLWCKNATLTVNSKELKPLIRNNIAIIDREWSTGDVVELNLPMDFKYSFWYQNSVGIERGPLVYALKIEEDWREVKNNACDNSFMEVMPKSPWNYAIMESEIDNSKLTATVKDSIESYPWNLANAPIVVKTKAMRMPTWQIYRGAAGKIPSNSKERETDNVMHEIELIPYGCTTLRISEFPIK